MGDTLKLALQLSMIDLMSAGLRSAKSHIRSLGEAGKAVQRDFDLMERSITRGLKGIAVANYAARQINKGIKPAADLQESMIDVRMSLMRSGKDAAVLNRELDDVRKTAVDLQKIAPFSASDVTHIEKELINAGLEFNDVVGKGGATFAATALATITKEDPVLVAKALVTTGSVFGVQGNEYRELADQFQRIGMNSLAKVPDLMEGMKYVSQTAKNMKLSWKDTLAALGTLGEQGQIGSIGGTNLNDFLVRLTGASRITRKVLAQTNQDLRRQGKDPLEFWDKQGKLKSLPAIIANLRESMAGFSDHKKMYTLEKIFGEQGMRAALGLMKEGLGSWEATNEKMRTAASLEEKMNERLKGFNANVTALAGTSKTTLATMFDPMLQPLTRALQMMNDLVDATGRFAAAHPNITATGNGVLATVAAGAAAYGVYNLAKGGAAGARVLKGLGGVKGVLGNLGKTSLGIAEGKAVQAATGVTPVFVTNWPGSFAPGVPGLGGTAGGAATVAGGSLAGSAAVVTLPAAVAGSVGYAAYKTGQWHARNEASWRSNKDLADIRARQMVMGGGGSSFQVKAIDEEMRRRWQSAHNSPIDFAKQGRINNEIKIDINIDGQGRISTSTNGMNNKVDTMKRGSFFNDLNTAMGLGY